MGVAADLRPCRKRKSHRKSMACLRWLPLLTKVVAQLPLCGLDLIHPKAKHIRGY